MAIAATIIPAAAANANSWLQRALSYMLPMPPASIPPPIEMTIVDLRLILRRIDHAKREHAHWDARYLAQTVSRAIIAPLEQLELASHLHQPRHGAVFALTPVAAIASTRARAGVDVDSELAEAANHLLAAIAMAESSRTAVN